MLRDRDYKLDFSEESILFFRPKKDEIDDDNDPLFDIRQNLPGNILGICNDELPKGEKNYPWPFVTRRGDHVMFYACYSGSILIKGSVNGKPTLFGYVHSRKFDLGRVTHELLHGHSNSDYVFVDEWRCGSYAIKYGLFSQDQVDKYKADRNVESDASKDESQPVQKKAKQYFTFDPSSDNGEWTDTPKELEQYFDCGVLEDDLLDALTYRPVEML
jgi:hypothetical protein